MQDADVPLWDKGDNTDNFAKGGGSSFSLFDSDEKESKNEEMEKVYELVLGRKPTSREIAYYRYSTIKKGDIVNKLLKSDEHKQVIEKGRKYPDLENQEKLAQSNILKLRHSIEDQNGEMEEMKSMLEQKNREIAILREEKRIPYVTQSFLEGKGTIYYTNVKNSAEKNEPERISWLDKIADFIKKLS